MTHTYQDVFGPNFQTDIFPPNEEGMINTEDMELIEKIEVKIGEDQTNRGEEDKSKLKYNKSKKSSAYVRNLVQSIMSTDGQLLGIHPTLTEKRIIAGKS